jgi:hypothetical protein
MGGVGDPVTLVIALVLHAQLRAYQGFGTWWALADLRWAFDVADIPAMKAAAFLAGIGGVDWLLLDDILDNDTQRVALQGLISCAFMLGCGTAQGRRFSVQVFNGLLKWLADEVWAAQPFGCAAWLPPFGRRLLEVAECMRPTVSPTLLPRADQVVGRIREDVSQVASGEVEPWPQAQEVLLQALVSLPTLADRAAAVEALGDGVLGPLQFVDDLTVPCPSQGAARSVCSQEPESACSRYALKFKAAFHHGKGKTVIMPILVDLLPPGNEYCDRKVLLGVLVDSGLTFLPLWKATLAMGKSLFTNFFYAAETGGFSIPVAAAQVQLRVEPALLFSAPLLVGVSKAWSSLNHLQCQWGRRLLGAQTGPRLKFSIVAAQCGWELRLGTKMLERGIMARANLLVLPQEHPSARMLSIAMAVACDSWAAHVKAVMSAVWLPSVIGDITEQPRFPPDRVARAKLDKGIRKALLRDYKWLVVRPVLLHYDREAFLAASAEALPAFGISFGTFVPRPTRVSIDLLRFDHGPGCWRWYRLWALCRMTGRWPRPVFGDRDMPIRLDVCGACGARDITVVHGLCWCPALSSAREVARVRGLLPPPWNEQGFLLGLFREGPPPELRSVHIEFVGRIMGLLLGPSEEGLSRIDEHVEGEFSSAAATDTWLRIQAERARFASDTAEGLCESEASDSSGIEE